MERKITKWYFPTTKPSLLEVSPERYIKQVEEQMKTIADEVEAEIEAEIEAIIQEQQSA